MDDSALTKVIQAVSKVDNSIDSIGIMNAAYETTFGIIDHLGHEEAERSITDPSKKRPLISSAYSEVEEAPSQVLKNHAKIFAELEIHKLFGLTLFDFISLSKTEIEDLLSVADGLKSTENAETKKVIDELKNST